MGISSLDDTYLRLMHHQLQLAVYALVVEWGTNGRDWSQACDQWNGVIEIVTFISWWGWVVIAQCILAVCLLHMQQATL